MDEQRREWLDSALKQVAMFHFDGSITRNGRLVRGPQLRVFSRPMSLYIPEEERARRARLVRRIEEWRQQAGSEVSDG